MNIQVWYFYNSSLCSTHRLLHWCNNDMNIYFSLSLSSKYTFSLSWNQTDWNFIEYSSKPLVSNSLNCPLIECWPRIAGMRASSLCFWLHSSWIASHPLSLERTLLFFAILHPLLTFVGIRSKNFQSGKQQACKKAGHDSYDHREWTDQSNNKRKTTAASLLSFCSSCNIFRLLNVR